MVIDVEGLLAPLGLEDGAGIDLRDDFSASSIYQRMRDARNTARSEERANDIELSTAGWSPEAWRELQSLCETALADVTKDFEVASWLTEALVRIEGLPGLNNGATLLTGLVRQFWDEGYPRSDDEGWVGRISPIGGLSGANGEGTIMQPLRRLALFRRADGTSVGQYLWSQADQAAGLTEERREAKYAAGVPDMAVLKAEASLDRDFTAGVGQDVRRAAEAWKVLDDALTERLGGEAPSMRRVSDLLQEIEAILTTLGAFNHGSVAAPDPVMAASFAPPTSSAAQAQTPERREQSGGLSRDEALRQLEAIAAFFRKTEPHSPLSYTLDEAVRRANLSLPELLSEVLPNEEARQSMLWRLGMRSETNE